MKGRFQIGQRNLTGPQVPALIGIPSCIGVAIGWRGHRIIGDRCDGLGLRLGFGFGLELGFNWGLGSRLGRALAEIAFRRGLKTRDQRAVISVRLNTGGFQVAENFLDLIDRGQNQRDRWRGHIEPAIPETPKQGLARMGDRFQPWQADKPAGALDRVYEAEDVVQRRLVGRVSLKPNQFNINRFKAFRRLGQKFT